MDTFNYTLKISLKAETLSRCSSNLNNGLDIVHTGRMFKYTCTTIVFKFYLKIKMKITKLQVILDALFNQFIKVISGKKYLKKNGIQVIIKNAVTIPPKTRLLPIRLSEIIQQRKLLFKNEKNYNCIKG